MTPQEIESMIDRKLAKFKQDNLSFRSFIKMDRPRDAKTIGSFQFQKPIAGSTGGNAALQNLLTALAQIGLINNNTT